MGVRTLPLRAMDDRRIAGALLVVSAAMLVCSLVWQSSLTIILAWAVCVMDCFRNYPGRTLRVAASWAKMSLDIGLPAALLAVVVHSNVLQVTDDPVAWAAVPVLAWSVCVIAREALGVNYAGSPRMFE